ncbi:MAG: cupin domain-containing protein [Rhodobacteraceae bacterium]|nr:cupin domain-containing protein [Paracoccaceae bacterium]
MTKVNLHEKLALFDTHWDPKIVAQYNGNDIMIVKFAGEFPFHKHDDSDDFFLILEGEVTLDSENGTSVVMGPGELCVVPAGITHRPRAETEAKVLLIEPSGLPNTGDTTTVAAKPWI